MCQNRTNNDGDYNDKVLWVKTHREHMYVYVERKSCLARSLELSLFTQISGFEKGRGNLTCMPSWPCITPTQDRGQLCRDPVSVYLAVDGRIEEIMAWPESNSQFLCLNDDAFVAQSRESLLAAKSSRQLARGKSSFKIVGCATGMPE